MQKTISINNQQLKIKEYEGSRVVTFKDIDAVHNRPDGTASRNFRTNKKRFVEGEDYHRIHPDEIRRVGINSPNGGIVVTETGYLMLVKSFTDDLAWAVQRQLVNTYFKYKEESIQPVDEYEPKYYNGRPVITLRDLESLTGVSSFAIRYKVKQRLQYFCDYYLLEGEELANFKSQNKSANKLVSCLIVITQQGFIKLVKIIKGIPMLDCFKTALPEPKKESEEIKYCVNLPQNEEAQFMISDIGRKANTVLELLYQMSFQNTKEYHEALCTAVDTLTMRMSVHSSFRLIEYDYGYVD